MPLAAPALTTSIDHDERALLRVLLALHLLAALALLAGLLLPGDWRPAALAGLGPALGFTLYVLRRPRAWLLRLYVFALAAGWAELAADAWLVWGARALVYPEGGPFVLASPLYMPFAWAGVVTTLAVLARVLTRRVGGAITTAIVGAVAGVYIPAFEALAIAADWWRYPQSPAVVAGVPVFIAVGEALLGAAVGLLAPRLDRLRPTTIAGLGALVGLGITLAYAAPRWLEGLIARDFQPAETWPALTLVMMIASGLTWLGVYALAIHRSFRDRACAIPGAALAANLAWEFLYTVRPGEQPIYQWSTNAVWLGFDVALVIAWLRFAAPRGDGRVRGVLVALVAFAAALLLHAALDARLGDLGAHGAFAANVLMSVLFVTRLQGRDDLAGQSLAIALGKWLGTLFATIGVYFAIDRPQPLLLALMLVAQVYDVAYIVMVARRTRAPTIAWTDGQVLVSAGALATLISLVGLPLCAGWISATLASAVGVGMCVVRARRSPAMQRWLLFAGAAAAVEQINEVWLVELAGLLRYAPGGPWAVASPLYMPLSWVGVLTALACAGAALTRKLGPVRAALATGLATVATLPGFEALGAAADWWYYAPAAGLGPVPWFVIAGHFMLGLPLAWLGAQVLRAGPGRVVLAGAAHGLWIFAATWLCVVGLRGLGVM